MQKFKKSKYNLAMITYFYNGFYNLAYIERWKIEEWILLII
jgi:hypothetical protein